MTAAKCKMQNAKKFYDDSSIQRAIFHGEGYLAKSISIKYSRYSNDSHIAKRISRMGIDEASRTFIVFYSDEHRGRQWRILKKRICSLHGCRSKISA